MLTDQFAQSSETVHKQRKRKTLNPCPSCLLHLERCICAQIPRLNLKTKLSLIIHAKEIKRTTNTGQLAIRALINAEMHIRGERNQPLALSTILSPDYDSYVLYPGPDAIEANQVRAARPIQLIVADGNWRQAGKLNTRHPELRHLPRIKVSTRGPAEYHLRKEHFADGLSTLEAIALALQALEGEAVGKALLALYHAKLRATLQGRGIPLPPTL